MRTTAQILAIAALALNVGVRAEDPPRGEQLMFIQPEGWEVVYEEREDNLSTTEYVPPEQTEGLWHEMLTVQIMLEERDANPDLMLTRAVDYLSRRCESFDALPIQLAGVGKYPTLAVMTLCGLDTSSRLGEVSLLRAIAGEENFYLLQKAWRVAPFDVRKESPVDLESRKFWLGYLAYMRVCNPAKEDCLHLDTAEDAVPAGSQ